MITIGQIEKAMRMIENPREYLSCETVHKQIVKSLEVYESRGEYDGTIESAIHCLKLAEYEIEYHFDEGTHNE